MPEVQVYVARATLDRGGEKWNLAPGALATRCRSVNGSMSISKDIAVVEESHHVRAKQYTFPALSVTNQPLPSYLVRKSLILLDYSVALDE